MSRTVVREALNQLVFERVIYKLQGKGAFVSARRDEQDFLGSNIGFSGELHDKNRAVTRHILRQEFDTPSERARRMLQLQPEEKLFSSSIAFSASTAFRVSWSTPRWSPGTYPAWSRCRCTIARSTTRCRGSTEIAMRRAERWLEEVAATADQAQLLGVADSAPF